MSTRSAIVRADVGGFSGRYHHWDGYPSGLGRALWGAYHGYFHGDLKAMLAYLIDKHPAGWSTIAGCDFALPAGFDGPGPHCYCHGSRHEEANLVTEYNADQMGCEWVYAFDEAAGTMSVLASYTPDGDKMIGMFGSGDPDASWRAVATLPLDGPEPDWDALDRGVYAEAK